MPGLESLKRHSLVITLVCIYLVADMILTGYNFYYFNLFPVVFLMIYLVFARLDLMYYIIIFCTPLSVQLIDFFPNSPIDFAIPSEPILFGMMMIFYYKILYDNSFDIRITRHPVTYAIFFNIIWIVITTLTSSMPLVSFKFLLARIWFVTIYYFLAVLIFKEYRKIPVFIWSYVIAMIMVVIYTIARHMQYGLNDTRAAHIVMSPFFRDHTSYGAVLAMLIFALAGVIIYKRGNILFTIFSWGILVLLSIGLLLSFTRAAWVSIIAATGILGLTIFRVQFKYIVLAVLLVFVYLADKRTELLQKMEHNRQNSSATITEHVRSMSNISTDESNLERINRWNSALRMFREKPVFGYGPGTYMFRYAPYQRSNEKTAISTDFGDLGNAHSEYIGPLAESGVFGSLSFIIVGVVSVITGFRVYNRLINKKMKGIVLGMILGLITYLIHGALNNFLDTDKVSALFWGFIAAFVSLDIYYPWEDQEKQGELEKFNAQH